MNNKYYFQNYTGTEIETLLDNINYILQWNGTSSTGDPTIWNKIASNYITLGTNQWNITGGKTFKGEVYFDASSTTRIYTTPSNGSDVVNKNYVDTNKGTKLYQHTLIDEAMAMTYILITDSPTPLNFVTLDTYSKIFQYFQTINVITFYSTWYSGIPMTWDSSQSCFTVIYVDNNSQVTSSPFSDWNLSRTTDVVTEL